MALAFVARQPREVEHPSLGIRGTKLPKWDPQLLGQQLLLIDMEPAMAMWPVPLGVQPRVYVEVLRAG